MGEEDNILFADYVACVDSVVICDTMTIDEILVQHTSEKRQEESYGEEEIEPTPVPKLSNAMTQWIPFDVLLAMIWLY